mgnify:CR=1 FL=1
MNTTAILNITVPMKLVTTIAFSIAVSPNAPSKRPVRQKKIATQEKIDDNYDYCESPHGQPTVGRASSKKEKTASYLRMKSQSRSA